jgi:hypothetical protein
MTLTTDEFIRRFLLHVLPFGFHRIRHYGLIANTGRKANLGKVRQLLKVPPPVVVTDDSAGDDAQVHAHSPTVVCPGCGSPMMVTEVFAHQYLPRAPPLSFNKQ